MKHIKIYEDYTDEEIRDLVGDLQGIGHHKVDFDVSFEDYPEAEEYEKRISDGWTSKSGTKIFLSSVSGEIGEEVIDLEFKFSNGDKANLDVYYMVGPHGYGNSKDHVIFTLNGRKHDIPVDTYLEHLEDGSVVKASMEIYDSIER
jgi:hypothetical protein